MGWKISSKKGQRGLSSRGEPARLVVSPIGVAIERAVEAPGEVRSEAGTSWEKKTSCLLRAINLVWKVGPGRRRTKKYRLKGARGEIPGQPPSFMWAR